MRKGKRTGMEAQIVEIINNRLWKKNDFISTEDIYSLIPNKKDNIDYTGCIKKAKKIIRDHLQGIGLQLEEKIVRKTHG